MYHITFVTVIYSYNSNRTRLKVLSNHLYATLLIAQTIIFSSIVGCCENYKCFGEVHLVAQWFCWQFHGCCENLPR